MAPDSTFPKAGRTYCTDSSGLLKEAEAPLVRGLQVWIPDTLGAFQSLSRLRLYGAGAWLINYAKSLLLQAAQCLSVVKACRPCFPRAREKVTWTSNWKYDEELQFAFRRVTGPLEGEITTLSDPLGWHPRKRASNNARKQELQISEAEWGEFWPEDAGWF
ncbi:hypothetical protein FRC17_004516 [Serendipita sp. 399]|nr:hypothetical protein FRC17_004516 [Serendipita sp. 399]